MSLLDISLDSTSSPLAVVEEIAASNDLAFERSGEDEVTIVYKGRFTDYQVSFTWMPEIDALHLACAFDMKIPAARNAEVQRLIAAANEQMWVGHFDLWSQSGLVMHRQSLLLPGNMTASNAQCEAMLAGAIHACERYYPALQFVVWPGSRQPRRWPPRCSTPRVKRKRTAFACEWRRSCLMAGLDPAIHPPSNRLDSDGPPGVCAKTCFALSPAMTPLRGKTRHRNLR